MKCDELLPLDAKFCPNCGADVTNMKFSMRSNLRGAKLAAQEEVKKHNEKYESERKYQELCKKYAQERKEADKTIVSAVLISAQNKKSGASALGRAVVGGALLGPVGAIAGASTGKSYAKSATFSVKYASGRTSTETVSVDSKRFKELSSYLHN